MSLIVKSDAYYYLLQESYWEMILILKGESLVKQFHLSLLIMGLNCFIILSFLNLWDEYNSIDVDFNWKDLRGIYKFIRNINTWPSSYFKKSISVSMLIGSLNIHHTIHKTFPSIRSSFFLFFLKPRWDVNDKNL